MKTVSKEPEIVRLGNEDVEVWPEYCTRPKRNCTQCYFEGKLQCSPAHRPTATLSKKEKTAIAAEAKQRGVLTVAQEKGIPMFMVRAWVGAYCRGAKIPKTLERCLLCGAEFYIKPSRAKNGPPQYCGDCTKHALRALRSGKCPGCKTRLEVCAATRELRCGKCEKTWPISAVFGDIAELLQEVLPQKATERPKTTVRLVRFPFSQKRCLVCDVPFTDLVSTDDVDPYNIELRVGDSSAEVRNTDGYSPWLCKVCAEGLKKLFDLIGIDCRLEEGEAVAPAEEAGAPE